LQLLFTYAPPLQALFDTEGLPFVTWLRLVLGGFVFFLLVEAEKMILRRVRSSRSVPVMTASVTS
jgi:hypothetical protein